MNALHHRNVDPISREGVRLRATQALSRMDGNDETALGSVSSAEARQRYRNMSVVGAVLSTVLICTPLGEQAGEVFDYLADRATSRLEIINSSTPDTTV